MRWLHPELLTDTSLPFYHVCVAVELKCTPSCLHLTRLLHLPQTEDFDGGGGRVTFSLVLYGGNRCVAHRHAATFLSKVVGLLQLVTVDPNLAVWDRRKEEV